MSDGSKIEWTDATWGPVLGCTKVSPGCDNCYAITTARIRESNPNAKVASAYAGIVHRDAAGQLDWTGQVNLLPDRFDQPLHWKKPRRIFVNSQSDLFHEQVPDLFVAKVFAVMAAAKQHTFQLLTKRHSRMRSLLSSEVFRQQVMAAATSSDLYFPKHLDGGGLAQIDWPLTNLWLGVSVENQQWADIRIPALLDTPAAVRWVSMEPLLGPVDLIGDCTRPKYWLTGAPAWGPAEPTGPKGILMSDLIMKPGLNWIVVGGESGHGARPMHPAWARTIRDQCATTGVPFFMKQTGTVLAREWGLKGKGDDPAAWPEPFTQEYPNAA